MEDISDESKLFSAFLRKDEKAFEFLFHRFYSPLCLFAIKFDIEKESAEELVQDVLLKIWSTDFHFDSYDRLKSFLYLSTKNASINYLDKRKRRLTNYDNYANQINSIVEDDSRWIIYAETLQLIKNALEKLPTQCAAIMKLNIIEGLETKEIAQKLNITSSTVYTQKTKGLALLKQLLDKGDYLLLLLLIDTLKN